MGGVVEVVVVVEAERVERLAYTRGQAAEALGISFSTFNRRVLPPIEMVRLPWGTRLVPVDEVERLLADGRQPAAPVVVRPRGRPGRKPGLPDEVVARIQRERASGKGLAEIARGLNIDEVGTAQGGRQWWASTVRSVLVRAGQ